MSAFQKGVLWMAGCLVFMFVLSIVLSWLSFGYLDPTVVGEMGMMLMPLLAVAVLVFFWSERGNRKSEAEWGRRPSSSVLRAKSARTESRPAEAERVRAGL